MKTHLVDNKQNRLQSIVVAVLLVLSSLIGKAQVNTMELQITHDVLNSGSGIATLVLDQAYVGELSIQWRYYDHVNNTLHDYSDVLSIDHLHEGIVHVWVRAVSCDNKLIFESTKEVKNDKQSFSASINVATNAQSCDNVFAELTVVVQGGIPPYQYGWGDNHMTVYDPGGYGCEVMDSYGNKCVAEVYVSLEDLQCAVDPNEIIGPNGYGDEKMISATQKIPYTITFENDPEFATAPASRVEIEYPIPEGQRASSFRLSDFGFGQFIFTVPSNTSSYYQRIDVSDSLGVWVDVTAGIDVIHNKAFWVFQSIDPSTGSEPQSSQLGFLLVNDDEGHGEGYVSFQISPANGMHTGDTTAAEATIVFDDNAPIGTNVWTNMFDAVAPTSSIVSAEVIATDSTQCVINFASQDDLDGSGVHSLELFVSINGSQYTSVGSYTPGTEVNYPLMNGSYYNFICIATDNVGNVEEFKTIPDAVVDYSFAPSDITLSKYYFYENDLVGSVVGELNTIDIGDLFMYQLVAGEGNSDNDLFAISGNKLVTNADFNCENRLDYSVRVRSTDVSNLYVERVFEISMVKTNQTYDLSYESDVCNGGTFVGYGWNIDLQDSVPGTYTYTRHLQTTRGCDSIRTLTLNVYPTYSLLITDEILEGESYTMNGFNIVNPEVGVLYDTLYLQTVHGCDSLVMLELTVNSLAFTQTNTLTPGWNWWSTYIDMSTEQDFEMLKNALGSNASMIKSRADGFVTYYGDWYGTLSMLTNREMYMINMNSEQEISMVGPLATLAGNPITLNQGWNWIGYPTNRGQEINAALANLSPMGNDMLKSRNAFATYYPSLGWVGTLSDMTPGTGYMYNSSNAEPIEFVYATPSKMGYQPKAIYGTNHWEVSVGGYETNATIIGVIDIDGEEQRNENLVVGAFIGNNCVGQTNAMYLEAFNRYLVFLTYFGNENDEIVFRLYDEDNDMEYGNSETTVMFASNSMLGTLDDPFVIEFNTMGVDESFYGDVTLFPNPVGAKEKVRVALSEGLAAGMKMEVVSSLGMQLYQTTVKGNVLEITAPQTPGIYIVKITDKDGNVYFGKLIVE